MYDFDRTLATQDMQNFGFEDDSRRILEKNRGILS